MSILLPDSAQRLAPTLSPLLKSGGRAKDALQALRKAGAQAVQLDASLPGLRPRELDRRARRDLVASCARAGLEIAGIDLFVPRKHLTEPEHQDRAVAALSAAIDLAAELGKRPVSVGLPVGDVPGDVIDALIVAADAHGVPLAIHSEDRIDQLAAWLKQTDHRLIGAALDPAALLSRDKSPIHALHQLSKHVFVARLSDSLELASGERNRCVVGDGDLDLLSYRVSLSMCEQIKSPCVLDVRQIGQPGQGVVRGLSAWADAAPSL